MIRESITADIRGNHSVCDIKYSFLFSVPINVMDGDVDKQMLMELAQGSSRFLRASAIAMMTERNDDMDLALGCQAQTRCSAKQGGRACAILRVGYSFS